MLDAADIQKAVEVATGIVKKAKADGTLSKLTPKVVRRETERVLEVEEGAFDEEEYKNAIKEAVRVAAMKEPVELDESKEPSRKKAEKRNSESAHESEDEDEMPKVSKRKHKATVESSGDESKSGPSNGKPPSKTKKARNDKLPSTRAKKIRVSKAEIQNSDAEEERKPPKKKQRKTPVSKTQIEHSDADQEYKSPKQNKTAVSKIKIEDSDSDAEEKPKSKPKSKSANGKAEPKTFIPVGGTSDVDAGEKSESELSVLIDDPPKKKGGKKKEDGEPKPKKSRTSSRDKPAKASKKSSSSTLSKDEETIKKLKSYVVTCGVRKVWSKEFQGLDTPLAQIKRLKEILTDLGMTGRMSMEQAKEIRERRELAKELEDVTQFEAKMLAKGKGKRKPGNSDQTEEDGEEEEEEQEQDGVRKVQRNAARRSILAFLGDQSDDE
ncbi:hypothetical protein NEOLEDRAFT_1245443 [Neolentinus lepideus HHB14362 ss-1]|uniref:Uncharacterized protein n=1 Tax=Neolentinus lepideus HHB14362 ss-1 TaxID=1314782 RepID=A0A165NTV1_9AGAM|nr:hypothetical protein NEOLEDRAFT_1245443 [Neolentinus lepideus HHB14362 ss-1]